MGAISKEQAIAILRGNRLYATSAGIRTLTSIKWSGISYKDLFNPSGINLTAANITTPVYPYIPGTADPASQVISVVTDLSTITDSVTFETVLILQNGGDLNTIANLQPVENDYHLTGNKLRKKLK